MKPNIVCVSEAFWASIKMFSNVSKGKESKSRPASFVIYGERKIIF